MLLKECALVGLKELWANKLRSFLSVLGIIVGVIALIAMMSLMTGIERGWLKQLNEIGGLKKATITPKIPVVNGIKREELKKPLTLDDADALKKEIPMIRFVAASAADYKEVNFQGRNQNYLEITGSTPDIFSIDKQRLENGRLLTSEDLESARSVCVIGAGARSSLFGSRVNPIGQPIQIGGHVFDVVGLLKERKLIRRKQNVLESENQKIYVPYTVLSKKFNNKQEVAQIDYVVSRQRDITRVQQEATRILAASHGAEDIEVQTQEEQYQQSRKTLRNMKIGFSAIAGISLIVGGIGILNVMMANIAQRVREIGIRKAVGAKSRDILFQFLVESTIVSTTGGIAGLLGSFVVVFLLGLVFRENPPIIGMDAIILATFSSVQVGVLFGIYPAIKASKLDPILALRYQ